MNIVNREKEKNAKALDLKEVIKNVENSRKYLKAIFKGKKEIKQEFLNKLKQLQKQIEENQKWFDKEWQKLEKLEIQSILW